MFSSNTLLQQARLFIAATLFGLVGLVLVSPFSVPASVLDSTAGASLILAESNADDTVRILDTDSPFDAPLPIAALIVANQASPLSATHHPLSSYLISFIGAPPRAPPSQQHI
jgi:hypothetical protein